MAGWYQQKMSSVLEALQRRQIVEAQSRKNQVAKIASL